jgi:hypothetical protein
MAKKKDAATTTDIEFLPPEQITFKFTGLFDLLMNNARGVDKLDPLVIEKTEITKKKEKTDDDEKRLAQLDWEVSIYYDDEMGPYLPCDNMKRAIRDGATRIKKGKDIGRAVVPLEERARLEYDGPRDLAALWASGRFSDRRSVVINNKRIMRRRPRFPIGWNVTFALSYDPAAINRKDLVLAAEYAGKLYGLGDYRPDTGGPFGRFGVEVLK